MFCYIFGVMRVQNLGRVEWVARHYLYYMSSLCSGGFTVFVHCREVWVGGRRDAGSGSDHHERISVQRDRGPALHWINSCSEFFRSHVLLDWTTTIFENEKIQLLQVSLVIQKKLTFRHHSCCTVLWFRRFVC
jgi:hypothetical protein